MMTTGEPETMRVRDMENTRHVEMDERWVSFTGGARRLLRSVALSPPSHPLVTEGERQASSPR